MRTSHAAVLIALGLGSGSARADTLHSLVVGGQTRTYLMHVPAGVQPAKTVPVVFVLHGLGGDAAGIAHATGFDAVADANHFIVIYPNGLNHQWSSLYATPPALGPDLDFFKALFDQLIATGQVDGGRMYVTGFSMGAGMTQELGCHFASRLAAIAPVSNTLTVDLAAACHPDAKLAVLEMHGTDDPRAPFAGGHGGNPSGNLMVSAPDMAGQWAAHDGCATPPPSQPLPDTNPADGSTVILFPYAGCAAGTQVRFYKIVHGGHFWPGAPGPGPAPGSPGGVINRDIDASKVIWDFFKLFKRY